MENIEAARKYLQTILAVKIVYLYVYNMAFWNAYILLSAKPRRHVELHIVNGKKKKIT